MSDRTEDQIREGLKLLAEDVQAPESDGGRSARMRRAPRVSLRLGVALAVMAICAALAGLAAAGAWNGSRSEMPDSQVGVGGSNTGGVAVGIVGGWVTAERGSDGTVKSVHVRLRSFADGPGLQLQVVHATPTGEKDVVYSTQISMNPVTWECATDSTGHIGPTGASGPIGWSGPHGPIHECHAGYKWASTLVPSDWRGGCQSSGTYSVVAGGVGIYRSFTCDAGQTGPAS